MSDSNGLYDYEHDSSWGGGDKKDKPMKLRADNWKPLAPGRIVDADDLDDLVYDLNAAEEEERLAVAIQHCDVDSDEYPHLLAQASVLRAELLSYEAEDEWDEWDESVVDTEESTGSWAEMVNKSRAVDMLYQGKRGGDIVSLAELIISGKACWEGVNQQLLKSDDGIYDQKAVANELGEMVWLLIVAADRIGLDLQQALLDAMDERRSELASRRNESGGLRYGPA